MTERDSVRADNHNVVAPTQAELYDSLRRIGELEDQKQSVQAEIDRRTEDLRLAMRHLEPDSLLFKMLALALGKPTVSPAATAPRRRSRTKSSKKTAQKARS
jgi:hypothetical protein